MKRSKKSKKTTRSKTESKFKAGSQTKAKNLTSASQILNVINQLDKAAVLAINPRGIITLFSAGAERILSYSAEDIVCKQNILSLFHPEDILFAQKDVLFKYKKEVPPLEALVFKASAGEVDKKTWTWVKKNGDTCKVDLQLSPLRRGKAIIGYIGIGVEITELVEARELLQMQFDIAQAANEASDLLEFCKRIFEILFRIPGVDCGGIYSAENDGAVRLIYHRNLTEAFVQFSSYFKKDDPRAQLVLKGERTYKHYYELGQLLSEEIREHEGLRTLAIMPIADHGQVVACLNMASHTVDDFDAQVRQILESSTEQLGSVMAKLKAKQAVIEAQIQTANVINNSPLGIHIYELMLNNQLIFTGANTAADQILGFEHRALFGLPIEEAFPSLAKTDIPERYRKTARDGVPWQDEQIQYEDERIKGAFDIHAFSPSPCKMAVFFQDITKRKEEERQLRHAQALLAAAIEQSSAGILIADAPDAKIQMCNSAGLKIIGLPEEKILNNEYTKYLNVFMLDGSCCEPRYLPLTRAIINGETVVGEEYIIKDAHGNNNYVLVNAAPIKDADGKIVAGIVVFTDITARRQAEEERRRFFHVSRDIITICDLEGVVRDINPQFQELTGYTFQDVLEHNIIEFIHPEDLETFKQQLSLIREEKNIVEAEIRCSTKDGGFRWLSCSAFPLNNEKIFYCVARDITEQKKAQELEKKMQAQLFQSAKLVTIGTMAAGVAHEINNPLMVAQGFLDLLKIKYAPMMNPDEEFWALMDKQANALKRIEKIVSGLKNYSRPDEDLLEIVDISLVIKETLALCENIFQKENLEIEKQLDPTIPKTMGHFGKIQQVVMNLLMNARDALEGYRPDPKIILRTFFKNHQIHITVQDNGPGIPKNIRNFIFDPFFTTKAPGKGTGLGLSISQSVITSYGGELVFETEEGGGSLFSISLPPTKAIRAEESSSAENTSIKLDLKILVAEDEPEIRQLIQFQLEDAGATVTIVRSAMEALQALEKETFDVLVTDFKMPKMSGEELINEIRKRKVSIKIVMISGDIFEDHSQFLKKYGHDNFRWLKKPFFDQQLYRAIQELTSGQR
jgi:two-component system, cell cycle sensor histidine kinase and response regulator CckA